MRCRACHRLIAIVGFALSLLAGGCNTQASKPAPSSPTVTATSSPTPEQSENDSTPFELESGFELLTRNSFDAFGGEPETWKATVDGIECSGKPKGYLYSKQPYENFTWRLDVRFPRPGNLKDESKFKGNTGFLVYITGEHKLWPMCIEVQGKNIQMAAIKENGGAEPVVAEDDDEARQKARMPVGQWNTIEIVSNHGALNVSLNGTPISSSKPGPLTSGLIGIQAEDHPFEVRRMRIRAD